MNTLILQARTTISAPKYGKLLDLGNGLRIVLDARKLSLPQGAAVETWEGDGAGSVEERLFSSTYGTWNKPTFDAPGRTVRFSGNSLLCNNTPLGDTQVAAATYIVVSKLDALPVGTTPRNLRVFAGVFPAYHSLLPYIGGLIMSTNGSTTGVVIPTSTGYTVGVYVFDGASSKYITSTEEIVTANPREPSTQSRISLGGNLASDAPVNDGLKGNIALFAQYDRAFSDAEMTDIMQYYRNEFSI